MSATIGHTLRALRHRNYRLYFIGQLTSMVGTWMQTLAQMWLVYRLTHSSFLLGLAGFVGQAPVLIFGLWGGAAADHYDRRAVLLWTQALALLQASVLGVLTVSGTIAVWQVFALAVCLGFINVFDMPARQAFVVDLVERADVPNAIALNTFIVNISRMIGPALAGFLVGFYGEGPCFLINAASYVAVIASLLLINVPRAPQAGAASLADAWRRITAGLGYAWRHPDMRAMLALLCVLSLAGVPFMVLMPLFTDGILRSGAHGMGLLMAASGLGALASSWLLARRDNNDGLMRLVGLSSAGFGAALILFAFSRRMDLSLAAMTLTGWGMMTAFTGCNTLLQELTSDAMRGRVMGLFSMTFMGVTPLGNLLSGLVADRIGAPAAVGLGGAVCIVSGALFLRCDFGPIRD